MAARVQNGALTHGALRWRMIVLPGTDTLPLRAWENLARFVARGGVVVALGAVPANSESEFPSRRVQELARQMFGEGPDQPRSRANASGGAGIFLPMGAEGLLPIVLDGVLEPDIRVLGKSAPLRGTHRRIEGHEVYFLINDSGKPWAGQVALAAKGPGELWDPATGQRTPVTQNDRLPLSLEGYGAAFLRFASARGLERYPARNGALPNLALRALPGAEPQVARGEFVREELTADAVHGAGGRAAWRAVGKLTKGSVDTYLFVRLPYSQPLDLSGTDCLVLDTWIPEKQQTPTQLLVILHEQDGGDFLASTGRLLGAAGQDRTFVPLTRFQLAGWSQDRDGVLDLTRIREVRMGWGGYLGQEGETVEFSFALPQSGSVARQGDRSKSD
jgi:hypothetical protein